MLAHNNSHSVSPELGKIGALLFFGAGRVEMVLPLKRQLMARVL